MTKHNCNIYCKSNRPTNISHWATLLSRAGVDSHLQTGNMVMTLVMERFFMFPSSADTLQGLTKTKLVHHRGCTASLKQPDLLLCLASYSIITWREDVGKVEPSSFQLFTVKGWEAMGAWYKEKKLHWGWSNTGS